MIIFSQYLSLTSINLMSMQTLYNNSLCTNTYMQISHQKYLFAHPTGLTSLYVSKFAWIAS